jgi:hypothetical protein
MFARRGGKHKSSGQRHIFVLESHVARLKPGGRKHSAGELKTSITAPIRKRARHDFARDRAIEYGRALVALDLEVNSPLVVIHVTEGNSGYL